MEKGMHMKQRRFSEEQVIAILNAADAGAKVVARKGCPSADGGGAND